MLKVLKIMRPEGVEYNHSDNTVVKLPDVTVALEDLLVIHGFVRFHNNACFTITFFYIRVPSM